jgi:hypothetical protein
VRPSSSYESVVRNHKQRLTVKTQTNIYFCENVISFLIVFVLESTEFQLVEQLFEKYNKILRPVNNVSKTIEVLLFPALVSIIGTDETLETITFEEWFGMVSQTRYIALKT